MPISAESLSQPLLYGFRGVRPAGASVPGGNNRGGSGDARVGLSFSAGRRACGLSYSPKRFGAAYQSKTVEHERNAVPESCGHCERVWRKQVECGGRFGTDCAGGWTAHVQFVSEGS